MTTTLHDKRFPGETEPYRAARDDLLRAELALRDQVERVAEMRRRLPPGGPPPEDYVFEEGPPDLRDWQTVREVRLSELFEPGRDTLILINFMFAPDAELPCPMCTMWADGYDAVAHHVLQRASFALVAKAELSRLRAWAASRDWRQIRLLSSLNNRFNADYHTENDSFGQLPSITVFHKDAGGTVRHFYSVEGFFVPRDGDPRHIDPYTPVWNLLDLTPAGRGDWYPSHSY